VRFTSLPFDSPTLYLIIYARNGNQIAKPGCVCIHTLGAQKSNANITTDFQAQSNGGSMAGHGSCILRRHDCAGVVMPNHVHDVFVLNSAWLLESIILSWKGFTARQINPLIGRTGRVWQRDYFDRLVRNARHLANRIRYIRRNPQKARLHEGEFVLYESELAKDIE
jgi:hypothetical protein